MAKLYFRYGAMNSGKSTAIVQTRFNYAERGMETVLIKPALDTKAQDQVESRAGLRQQVDILLKAGENPRELVLAKFCTARCVLVDEAQFLEPQQVDRLMELVVFEDVPVIAYGLRGDFQTNSFPGSRRLLEIAHSIEELKTICRCGSKAIFNGRKINGNFVFEGSQVAIDGEDKVTYESLCAKCYFTHRAGQ